jgi:putative protease
MSDNQGVFIGSLASYDLQKREAIVRLSGPLAPKEGDGLVFLAPGQELGLVVHGSMPKDGLLRLKTPERVRPGARVFLTGSTTLAKKAQKIIASAKTEIPIDLSITWENGTPLAEARLENGFRIQVKAGFMMERAKNQPVTKQQIEAQMRRTGGTSFADRNVEMDYSGDLFASLGDLNQLRRDLLTKTEEALLKIHRPAQDLVIAAQERLNEMDLAVFPVTPERRIPSLSVYADSLEIVEGAVEGGCKRIYFEPLLLQTDKDRVQKTQTWLKEALDICANTELIWKWPKITRADFLKFARPLLSKIKVDGIMVENIGAAEAVLAEKPNVRLYGASGLNVCNHFTVQALSPPFKLLTISPELSGEQMAKTIHLAHQRANASQLELMVQGNLEVMVTEDCIPCLAKKKADPGTFWGLQDFKRIFPLRQDDDKRTHIFNSAETCLLDYMPEVFNIGLDGVAVDARGRTEKYAREMTQIYLEAIELTKIGDRSLPEELRGLKERIRPMALGGLTYGQFIKGLKEDLS